MGEKNSKEGKRSSIRNILTQRLIGLESRNGTIDIWWMDDSGGISLLLPHILQRHPTWRKCELRVIVPRDSTVDTKEKQIESVRELLKRVRIPVKEIIVFNLKTAKIGAGSSMKTKCDAMYTRVSVMMEQDKKKGSVETKRNDELNDNIDNLSDETATMDAKQKIQKKLSYAALLGEAIANTSTDETQIIIVTMPFPGPLINPFLYMGMLDLTSNPCQKPTLFVRGTQKRILTMDS